MRFSRLFARLTAAVVALAPASSAFAWGAYGHRFVSLAGVQALPPEVPAFLRSPLAVQQIGELGREPDRSKGSGNPHDADLDPGHFVDVDDQGRVMGGPLMTALPPTREAYTDALRAANVSLTKGGYLPYTIASGWQQLVKDFAYWRVDRVGEARAPTVAQRRWFAADRRLRELITVRDLGYWSHFVGDASQPLHVSIHYNGWGDYPNPNGYTLERIHGPFEGPFVHNNVTLADVRAAMRPTALCEGPIMGCTVSYILETQSRVEPLYQLWKAGGFQPGDPRGRAFAAERLAAGASALRDLVTAAWRASGEATVGYPVIRVADVEAGRTPPPYDNLVGND